MANTYTVSIYFGSNDEGKERVERLKALQKKMGFPSLSECNQHCIDTVYKKEMKSKKGD